MKFNYINSTGEEALYEITPLNESLYKKILEEDQNFLLEISQKKNSTFISEEYINAALEMLQNYKKKDDLNFSKSTRDGFLVGVVNNKTILKEITNKTKQKTKTPKATLRKNLASNKIRMFEKTKMTSVLDS